MRHEPAGRVAARRSRLPEGLRLRARQGRLVRQRAAQTGQTGFSTHHKRHSAAGRADLRSVEQIGVVRERVRKMAQRMQDRGATAVLVTTSDGKLVGLLYREVAEQLAGVQT